MVEFISSFKVVLNAVHNIIVPMMTVESTFFLHVKVTYKANLIGKTRKKRLIEEKLKQAKKNIFKMYIIFEIIVETRNEFP